MPPETLYLGIRYLIEMSNMYLTNYTKQNTNVHKQKKND